MFEDIPTLLQKIDKNIFNLQKSQNHLLTEEEEKNELKQGSLLLKETTKLLSTVNTILLKEKTNIENNNNNNYLTESKIEYYYKEVIQRKKILSEITNKYEKKVKKNLQNKNRIIDVNFDIEGEIEEFDEEILNQGKRVDLEFITNYNENLLGKSLKNLVNTQNNLQESTKDIYTQGNKLSKISEKVIENEKKAETGNDYLDFISWNKKSKKYSLMIINIFLFLCIVLIFIYKLF